MRMGARSAAPVGQIRQQSLAWRKRVNAFEQSHWLRNGAKKEIGSDRVGGQLEKGAQLGSKQQRAAVPSVVERLDSHRVAGQKQLRDAGVVASAPVEQSEGVHAPQLGEAFGAPLFPGMDDRFGV